MTRQSVIVGVTMLVTCASVATAQPQWTPDRWADVETLKLCTTGPTEGLYCFPVWLVVIDGDVYVRLGNKAAERMKANTTGPVLPVEVDGKRFERVRAEELPDQIKRVSDAMASKYTSDIIVHLFSHPLTMRLRPESSASAAPGG